MSCIYDVIVVGGGTSGLACASELKRSGLSVLVIEQGKPLFCRQHNEPIDVANGIGGAGLFSDGKVSFFPSATNLYHLETEKLKDSYLELKQDLSNVHIEIPSFSEDWLSKSNDNVIISGDKLYRSLLLSETERNYLVFWFCSIIGTQNIVTEHKITRIEKVGTIYNVISFFNGNRRVDTCHRLVIAGGKHCSKSLYDSMVGVVATLNQSRIEFGIRLEVESEYFDLYNHPSTDVKHIDILDKDNVEIRTFCCCRDGEVIESNTYGFTGFNGTSVAEKTQKSNIGIHLRITSNSPFFQSAFEFIHQFGNAGKISLDSFMSSDFLFVNERIDSLFRKYIRKYFSTSIGHNAVLYYPSVESDGFSFMIDNDLKMPSEEIWVTGDATNKFRGLLPAMVSGYYVAKHIVQKKEVEIKDLYKKFHIKISNSEESVLVFTAQSKNNFYCRDVICEFVFNNGAIPINPFRTFGYFLNDKVERDKIRKGNNELVKRCDELWVFGPISDGVLFEIVSCQRLGKPVRFFTVASNVREIREIKISDLVFEPEVHSWQVKKEDLINMLMGVKKNNIELELSLFE